MTGDPGATELLLASAVQPAPLRMIWRERIPAAALSVIGGPPGIGKSSLVAYLVAEVSRRGPVLVSNAEDDVATVTRPRLDVAHALLDRVSVVPPDMTPTLPGDFEQLRGWVRASEAKLLVLDPIAAHFRSEAQAHNRGYLRELARIAREFRCAIVGVHHTTKGFEIGGPNSGLPGTARAVYKYGYDPDDEDRRALSCVKINGADEPPALLFSHETVAYEIGGGVVVEAGKLRKVRESGARAQRTRGKRKAERDAAAHEWLSEYLAAGDDCARKSNDVREQGLEAGHGWATLRRAKVKLEVEHERAGGYGAEGWWVWRLPDEHPLRNPDPVPDE